MYRLSSQLPCLPVWLQASAAKIENLLMEKSRLEGERDHAVDQLALFKKEVCTCLKGVTCPAGVALLCYTLYALPFVRPQTAFFFCSQMQAIIDEKEQATAEALSKV